jgi:GR25 family glycosyltransferase involved in LPS biosynthesis
MKVNEYFDRVVVINLDRRTDRMDKLGSQLDELGIEYERFSAVDSKELGIEGYIAGTMSHVAVWKKYKGQKILVLEDDALFCDDFNEKFAEVMQALPQDWDIFYLGVLLPKHTGRVNDINNPHWFAQVMSTGAQAYCLNPSKMDYFIRKIDGYEWYIDIALRLENVDSHCYVTQPNLVTQFPSYSDLRLEEVNDF